MIFTVVYMPTASEELALLWINATDQQAVADASDRIDAALREDAHRKGEPFYGDRYYVDPPLAVVYDVSVDDRLVQVHQIAFVGY